MVTDYENERRAMFWQGVHEDYARLKGDLTAWSDYQAEIALWDSTSGDGLEREPPYYAPDDQASDHADQLGE